MFIMTKIVEERSDCEEVVVRTDDGSVYSKVVSVEEAPHMSLSKMIKIWDKYPVEEFHKTYYQSGFDVYLGTVLQIQEDQPIG